jgi:long-subunit acyl-CoA synthetase (AMP-forming)
MTALPDSPLTACVLLALTRSAVCAPVNPDLRKAELESLIPELAAEVLVAHGPCAAEARHAATQLGIPIVEVEFQGLTLQWTGLTSTTELANEPPASPDDLALILLTSGSSARPKRVPLTHRHLTLAAGRMVDSIQLGPYDCCLNMMPMFHVGAVVDLL